MGGGSVRELLERENGLLRRGDGNPRQVGVALSGGGIRSATFSLGVLQALARHDLLPRIGYLSTVSGGGYIGGLLGRLYQPEESSTPGDATERVKSALIGADSKVVSWLRDNGRYLSPRGRGDNFFAGGIYLRNLLAIHLNVGLFLLAIFAAVNLARMLAVGGFCPQPYWPALWAPLCGTAESPEKQLLLGWFWVSPAVLVLYACVAYLLVPLFWAYWLVRRDRNSLKIVQWPTMALTAPIVLLLAAWALFPERIGAYVPGMSGAPATVARFLVWIPLAAIAASLAARFTSAGRRDPGTARSGADYKDSANANGKHAGTQPPDTSVSDVRNVISGWTAKVLALVAALVLIVLVDTLGQTLYMLLQLDHRVLVTAVGAVIPLLIALGRFAAPAMSKDKTPVATITSMIASRALAIAGIVLALLVAVLWSAITHGLMWGFDVPTTAPRAEIQRKSEGVQEVVLRGQRAIVLSPAGEVPLPTTQTTAPEARYELRTAPDQRLILEPAKPRERLEIAPHAQWLPLVVALVVAILFAAMTGRNLEFLNLSSLHQFYQARLARAYLGAANHRRTGYPSGAARDGDHSVTTPKPGDDFAWDNYKPYEHGGPIHIINITLNETVQSASARAASTLVYRDRKGMNFALSPVALVVDGHVGYWDSIDAKHKGLRRVEPLAGADPGDVNGIVAETSRLAGADPDYVGGIVAETRKLGEWIAISGAAVTTGSGSRTSPGQSLLLGLAGVRLGYWWNSGRRSRGDSSRSLAPKLFALLNELTARFRGPHSTMWYLSDGGHFENTATYELLRRRLPLIIVSDNGCDGNYDFDDVANLVRKARIDLDTDIRFLSAEELDSVFREPEKTRGVFGSLEELRPKKDPPGAKSFTPDRYSTAHAAVARIQYPDATGLLILLKPTLTGREPVDVLQYASAHPDFPQESTADQFFDEAQWESYRKLGEQIAMKVLEVASGPELDVHLAKRT